jgi:hypothetical protein
MSKLKSVEGDSESNLEPNPGEIVKFVIPLKIGVFLYNLKEVLPQKSQLICTVSVVSPICIIVFVIFI